MAGIGCHQTANLVPTRTMGEMIVMTDDFNAIYFLENVTTETNLPPLLSLASE